MPGLSFDLDQVGSNTTNISRIVLNYDLDCVDVVRHLVVSDEILRNARQPFSK